MKVAKEHILIIGGGNMGSALARGLCAGDDSFQVRVFDIHPDRLQGLAGLKNLKILGSLEGETIADAAVILCVKPQDLPAVATAMRGRIAAGCLVVTILAGITMADVSEALGHYGAVVRAMPNIAANVGEAATALCANEACKDYHSQLALRIFSSIGQADMTREALLDAVTGLSGSGPAYLYMVIEALTDGGVKMGIPRQLALRLATQTVLGAAMLVKETGLHPAILREQVTTPGGTTISAIHELEERGLRAMLMSAVETATKRSATLRKKAKPPSS